MILVTGGTGNVGAELVPAEYVDAFFDFYVTGTLDESQPQPDVRDVTGRNPRTFRQWADAHASAFSR